MSVNWVKTNTGNATVTQLRYLGDGDDYLLNQNTAGIMDGISSIDSVDRNNSPALSLVEPTQK